MSRRAPPLPTSRTLRRTLPKRHGESLGPSGLRYGCSKLGRDIYRPLPLPCIFYLQIGTKQSRRADLRIANPCSSYEFACARSSPYWCVRKLRLFRRFSVILRGRFVHCVPGRTSPVAVWVAVSLALEHRRSGGRYSLTAVPEALTINMPPPCPIWMDS